MQDSQYFSRQYIKTDTIIQNNQEFIVNETSNKEVFKDLKQKLDKFISRNVNV